MIITPEPPKAPPAPCAGGPGGGSGDPRGGSGVGVLSTHSGSTHSGSSDCRFLHAVESIHKSIGMTEDIIAAINGLDEAKASFIIPTAF